MKKIVLLIGLLYFVVACDKQVMEKPANLIPEDKMVEILTDIAIYQAVEGYDPQKLTTNNVKLNDFIFNKYKVNAKVIETSNKYYASDVDGYKKLYEKVIDNLEERRKEVGVEIEKTTGVKPADAP
ncbi:DUF4296 domain-containing protein [Flavobacterium supellecticarium]|uniref:DUF4296 domain-containing protein n=1 Tax=Flavobacterium supellecticarium TaxID=2565924 RepID=A0A4V3W7S2_9FLAO|nr:DUF4296 domain-containing protein [Flavobacterium supellecticarium]THF48512.1 DUF4296 domain-containing protein [Flavobacterium supellecticarium]